MAPSIRSGKRKNEIEMEEMHMKEEFNVANNNLSSVLVIFGGTGDLTHRKLMPAFYNLVLDKLIPEHFAIVSVGRRAKTQEEYKHEIHASISRYSRNKIEDHIWRKLQEMIHYYQFDFTDINGYDALNRYLNEVDQAFGTNGNRVFYLAVAPEYFETIVHGLKTCNMSCCSKNFNRLVIEKPFGKDLSTARKLNNKILEVYPENSIYRIDHYLGKEMIQNIMVLRFANSIFDAVWNNKYIDNIQISLTETLGVGLRGGYYEHSGAMRDMVQNHIFQILTLVAMEPPINLQMNSIRSEKQKVLEAIEDITPDFLKNSVVFGQYGNGIIEGEEVSAYREEENVPDTSDTETFVAMKLHINNFRWAGTPFYIRTGKRLSKSSAEIVIQFKPMPNILYFKDKEIQEPNLLVLRIQPNVGVFFQFNAKDYSTHSGIIPAKMDTSTLNPIQGNTPEAYERLIYDILRGDATLFSRWDEVESAWMVADQLIQYREQTKIHFPNYEAGSMGPKESFELLAEDGKKWWNI
jgi:glucose-6-phosphate 1-dehydrogenase